MMTTRDSMKDLLSSSEKIIEQAEEQLELSNRGTFQMNEDYRNAQLELETLSYKIDKVMNSANAQQKEELHRLQLLVNERLNDMIFSDLDLTQFYR
ncbi:exonuclease VII large subunit [Gracilibacillus halotolerans]|uniref:Exonuclease VII large subunit n=1 Tax=Gracilibacillus halotolerans TaxID=74386 RepID=A0A841RJ86_9BACI|nr:DUF2524 family protein [Gracilibacillus halotolerans]MBB6511255.1 exonuclease VII large subunit [Gracilibacillus halotolerans]